jgi:hypothetical protein
LSPPKHFVAGFVCGYPFVVLYTKQLLLFQLFSLIEGTKPQKPKLKVSRKANTSTIRQQPRETKLEANVKILKLPLEDNPCFAWRFVT